MVSSFYQFAILFFEIAIIVIKSLPEGALVDEFYRPMLHCLEEVS